MKSLIASAFAICIALVLFFLFKQAASADNDQQSIQSGIQSAVDNEPNTESVAVPDGFEQILPRGRIASVDEPTYVLASEAKIEDDSFVLGVIVEGQPLAHSLNLLNSHEVVNGTIGKTNFAAVW